MEEEAAGKEHFTINHRVAQNGTKNFVQHDDKK
jgi:hypothetical protein